MPRNVPPGLIRAGNPSRLGHCGMFFEGALHLKWPDTIPGTDNHIIGSSHEPEIAILVLIGTVTCDIPVSTNTGSRGLRIAPVLLKHPGGTPRLNTYRNITLFVGWKLAAIMINDADIKASGGLAHLASLYCQRWEISTQQHRLRLPIPIANRHPCGLFPDFNNLLVQGLSSPNTVSQSLWWISFHISHWLIQNEHSVSCRRATQRRHRIFVEHL